MSRFLLPISRNWIGEEFYGSKYALHVASPHVVSPFLYAKCLLFACGARPACPRAAAYCNSFLQALRSGAIDSDLFQYIEHFDRSTVGRSPGLRRKDENELKIIRAMTPMQHRTMMYDSVKAAVYLRGGELSSESLRDTLSSANSATCANGGGNFLVGHSGRGSRATGGGASSAEPKEHSSGAARESPKDVRLPHRSLNRVRGRRGHPDRVSSSSSSATPTAATLAAVPAAEEQYANNNNNSGSGSTNTQYHEALECMRGVFEAGEVADLDVLSRELGLPPDVVTKAYEICLRERDLAQRKRALFS